MEAVRFVIIGQRYSSNVETLLSEPATERPPAGGVRLADFQTVSFDPKTRLSPPGADAHAPAEIPARGPAQRRRGAERVGSPKALRDCLY